MDSKITLSYGSKSVSTIVSNNFIDKYMTDARGSDVKVYIYLLIIPINLNLIVFAQ